MKMMNYVYCPNWLHEWIVFYLKTFSCSLKMQSNKHNSSTCIRQYRESKIPKQIASYGCSPNWTSQAYQIPGQRLKKCWQTKQRRIKWTLCDCEMISYSRQTRELTWLVVGCYAVSGDETLCSGRSRDQFLLVNCETRFQLIPLVNPTTRNKKKMPLSIIQWILKNEH